MKGRIIAYLAKCPHAVSGQNGHGTTFSVARALVRGFGLNVEAAMPFLQEYNQRCRPPWSDRELLHKLRDAEKKADSKTHGYLLLDNHALPTKPKRIYPGIGVPVKGVKPFNPQLYDASDTSFPLLGKKNNNNKDKYYLRDRNKASEVSSEERSDTKSCTIQKKIPHLSQTENFSISRFRADRKRQIASVPHGYDPIMWVRYGRAIPIKNSRGKKDDS
jgi:hypothetical protein